jgi:hypothetical protein
MARETGRSVERSKKDREGIAPRIRIVHVVDTARGIFLLPHEWCVVIRERAIAVVRVAQRRAVHAVAWEDGTRSRLTTLRQVRLTGRQARRTRPQVGGTGIQLPLGLRQAGGARTQLPLGLRQAGGARAEVAGAGIQLPHALWQTAWKWLCPDWPRPQQRPYDSAHNDAPQSVPHLPLPFLHAPAVAVLVHCSGTAPPRRLRHTADLLGSGPLSTFYTHLCQCQGAAHAGRRPRGASSHTKEPNGFGRATVYT